MKWKIGKGDLIKHHAMKTYHSVEV